MTEEKKGTLFYPSMASEEEIAEHEAGKRKLSGAELHDEILNDPNLKPGDRLLPYPKMDAQRQAEKDRLKGTIDLSKLNKGQTFHYPSLEDPEEKKTESERVNYLLSLAESDHLTELADELKTDLTSMGANEKDLGMIDYFRDIVSETGNPGLKDWAAEAICWIYNVKKR